MEEKTRHFGGQLFVHVDKKNNPVEDRINKNVERKHLKAYLRGDREFHHPSFGSTKVGGMMIPNMKPVLEVWK